MVAIGEPQQDAAVLSRARSERLRCTRQRADKVSLVLQSRVVGADGLIDAVDVARRDRLEVEDWGYDFAEGVGGKVHALNAVCLRHALKKVADYAKAETVPVLSAQSQCVIKEQKNVDIAAQSITVRVATELQLLDTSLLSLRRNGWRRDIGREDHECCHDCQNRGPRLLCSPNLCAIHPTSREIS
jgi:hypothetical protein